jgi:hypothetical protein
VSRRCSDGKKVEITANSAYSEVLFSLIRYYLCSMQNARKRLIDGRPFFPLRQETED